MIRRFFRQVPPLALIATALTAGSGLASGGGGRACDPACPSARTAAAAGVPESYGRRYLARELSRQGFRRVFGSCRFSSSAPGREQWTCRWSARKGQSRCRGNARVSNYFTPPESFVQSVRITRKRCVARAGATSSYAQPST